MSAIAAKAAEYDSDEDLVPTMIEEESEEVQEEVEVDTSLNNPSKWRTVESNDVIIYLSNVNVMQKNV